MVVSSIVGCGSPKELRSESRLRRGYIIVLPGVEGRSALNSNVAWGLVKGGVQEAIEIHDWTVMPTFLAAGVNLRVSANHEREARKIAGKIADYQAKYPGRPVHIIGHSGGGGVAIYVLESLPIQNKITSAILLAPAVSPNYDLRQALRRTRQGIWNFYSPYDIGFLGVGTSLAGTIDGQLTKSAGAIGFTLPWGLSNDDRKLYGDRLYQQKYNSKMAQSGHTGDHCGWANPNFVATWLAPLIKSQAQPTTPE